MRTPPEIVEYVIQQLDREEWWAVEASRDQLKGSTPTGEHWVWRHSLTDEPLELDPMVDDQLPDAFEQGGGYPYLASTEKYPYSFGGEGFHTVLSSEEVQTCVAGHLINNDPATSLADITVKRELLKLNPDLAIMLVQRWRDRKDFKPEWRMR